MSFLETLDLGNNQLTSLTLPEGLARLLFLDLGNNPLITLKLPEDLRKNYEVSLF